MSSEIKANSIQDKTGTRVLASDSGSAWSWGSGLPSGSIIQVQHTQYGDATGEDANMTSIGTNTNYVVCDGTAGSGTEILNVNITPKIYGSKIWLQCHWMGELEEDRGYDSVFFFWRNTVKIASAVTHGSPVIGEIGISLATRSYHDFNDDSTPVILNMQYFDAHGQTQSDINSGTQITYKLGFATAESTCDQLTTNRCISSSAGEVGVSSICAIELAP